MSQDLGQELPEIDRVRARARERAYRTITVNLWQYWYGPDPLTGKTRRHFGQERFIFGPHWSGGCAAYQGALTSRRWGKTFALVRKIILLLLLNPGDADDPCWGGVYGRTRKEAEKRLIRPLLAELRRLRRDLGIDLAPRWDKQNQEIHFANGTAILIGSYGKNDSLENQRGDTLAWAVVDEIERSFMSAEDILAVIGPAISDPRALHSCFVWASSPNGLRGMARKHFEAFQKRDQSHFLVTGTILDNPFLKPEMVEAIRAGLSRRMWAQEGKGICLAPTGAVFVAYAEERHVVPYTWDPRHRTVIGIDWGKAHAYICAIKVDERGRWVVARERKVTEVSTPQFREIVSEFIAAVTVDDNERLPALIACDGAVKDECWWLYRLFGNRTTVRWLGKDAEQGIGWGLNLIEFMLDPAVKGRGCKLYFADSLDSTTDPERMGLRGAMPSYVYTKERADSGEMLSTNDPSKKGGPDHPVDALRYALCASIRMEELHGGTKLPFRDPEVERFEAQRAARKFAREQRAA